MEAYHLVEVEALEGGKGGEIALESRGDGEDIAAEVQGGACLI